MLTGNYALLIYLPVGIFPQQNGAVWSFPISLKPILKQSKLIETSRSCHLLTSLSTLHLLYDGESLSNSETQQMTCFFKFFVELKKKKSIKLMIFITFVLSRLVASPKLDICN